MPSYTHALLADIDPRLEEPIANLLREWRIDPLECARIPCTGGTQRIAWNPLRLVGEIRAVLAHGAKGVIVIEFTGTEIPDQTFTSRDAKNEFHIQCMKNAVPILQDLLPKNVEITPILALLEADGSIAMRDVRDK